MPIFRTEIDGKYLNDQNRAIPKAHLDVVCQRSQGVKACRYICSVGLPEDGVFVCVKNTPLKADIDNQVSTNAVWRAKGNNCDGFGEKSSEEKQKGSEK